MVVTLLAELINTNVGLKVSDLTNESIFSYGSSQIKAYNSLLENIIISY